MVTRRGLFRLLGGLASSPILKPLAALIPVSGKIPDEIPHWVKGLWKQRSVARDLEVYYSSPLIAKLQAQTSLRAWGKCWDMPANTGKTIQFYAYKLPEGSVETV